MTWVNGYYIEPYANLFRTDLTGAVLTGVDLTGVTLTGAFLTGADLTGAILTGVKSGGITGPITLLPPGWIFTDNGYLVGPGADLTSASLGDVDLTGAILTGVKSGGITGSITLPDGWLLTSTGSNPGYLVGPGANLTGADLSDANLTGAILTGAILENAILTGVISGGIIGTPASLPTGWSLTDGVLIASSGGTTKDLSSHTNVSDALVTYPMLYSNAVFTHDGTKWFVEYTESSTAKKDTLIGVKKVAFSDKKVYLYGAGSGCNNIFNTSTTACVSDASSCGYVDGDVVLYAGGAVYNSILDSGYIINKSITIKSIPPNGSTVNATTNATLKNKANINVSRNYDITSDNVTIENIILDYNSNAKSTDSFMKIYGSGSPLRQIENITLKNVRCINLNVLRGFDINFAAKILIEGCYQQGVIEKDGIGLSSVSRCDIKSSNVLRGSDPGHGSIGMYATKIDNIRNGSVYSQGKNYTKTGGVFNEPSLESVHDGTKIKDYFNMCRYITIDSDNTFEDYKIGTYVVYKKRIFVDLSIPQDNTITQPFQYSFSNPSGSRISYTQDVNYFSASTLSESFRIVSLFFPGQTITVKDSSNSPQYPFGFGSISIPYSNLYVGNTLSVSNTTNLSGYAWTSGPTYTWYRGTTSLGTGSTYTVQPGDAGYSIHVVMTGIDSSSSTVIPAQLYGNGVTMYGPVSQTSPAIGPFILKTPDIETWSIPSKLNGDIFSLTLSSDSNGAFSYVSSPPGLVSISGNVATINGVGNVTITATKAANGNFSSASVSATFTIYQSPSNTTRDELKAIINNLPENDLPLYNGTILNDNGKDFIVIIPTSVSTITLPNQEECKLESNITDIEQRDNFIIFKEDVWIQLGSYYVYSDSQSESLKIMSNGIITEVTGSSKSIPLEIRTGVFVKLSVGSIKATAYNKAGTGRDPYVTTFSGHKYKLPNIVRTYRLLEYKLKKDTLNINATVSELTDSEKEEMKQIGLKEGTEKMFNGYFYESFYISNKKGYILFDRQLNIIEKDNFDYEITEGKGKFNCPIEGKSDYTSKTITVEDVEIKLMKYRNPQLLNGIDVVVDDVSNSKGILNSIYNPKDSMVKSIKSVKPLKEAKGIVYNYKQKELWVKKRVHL